MLRLFIYCQKVSYRSIGWGTCRLKAKLVHLSVYHFAIILWRETFVFLSLRICKPSRPWIREQITSAEGACNLIPSFMWKLLYINISFDDKKCCLFVQFPYYRLYRFFKTLWTGINNYWDDRCYSIRIITWLPVTWNLICVFQIYNLWRTVYTRATKIWILAI